jgi:Thymidylate kinase
MGWAASASPAPSLQPIELLTRAGLPAARQPSRAALGELARCGTHTYRDMSLACLCAADRHHQLDTEIKLALRQGEIVLCVRYVAVSSLALQGWTAYLARSCGSSTTACTGLTCPSSSPATLR